MVGALISNAMVHIRTVHGWYTTVEWTKEVAFRHVTHPSHEAFIKHKSSKKKKKTKIGFTCAQPSAIVQVFKFLFHTHTHTAIYSRIFPKHIHLSFSSAIKIKHMAFVGSLLVELHLWWCFSSLVLPSNSSSFYFFFIRFGWCSTVFNVHQDEIEKVGLVKMLLCLAFIIENEEINHG